jgi:subtilase family serine protease
MRLLKLIFSSRAIVALFLLAFPIWGTRAQTMNVSARLTRAVDETKLVALQGNVHALARLEYDRGPVPDSQPLRRLLLVLQRSPEQEAALQALLDEQQDKSSANFHAWLTPEQFGEQFGPADADVHALTQWLTAKGFTDIKVGPGRTVIEFSGNVANVRNAFHTEIHRYLVNGEEHLANPSDPQIPEALKPAVAGIDSLHDFRKKPMYHLAGISKLSKVPQAGQQAGPEYTFNCVDFLTSIFGAFPGQSASCYPLGPYDFATIYNVMPLWNAATPIDGTGQTIAIVARTNIDLQDVSDFRTLFGLPANTPQVILDGPDPGLVRGDETEADLDVEWSGAVAKGATIKLVVSESTETTDGVDLSALYIVDNNLAPVMSESYGQCEFNMGAAGNQFYNNLWQQAAAQGITAFVSSGDNGSAGCDFELNQGLQPPQPAQYGLQVSGIAATPYNVAVGGTDFNDYFNESTYWKATSDTSTHESAIGYIPETTWNASCTNAFFEDARFRMSANPETNCNNSGALKLVVATGGSGGNSNCTTPTGTTVSTCAGGYTKPGWQAAPGVPTDGKRDMPDVSLFASGGFFGSFYILCEADITNYIPCDIDTFAGVGGTSASSPTFAGLLALVNQETGSRQGNANYVLYKLAAKQSASSCNSSIGPASTCVFNDITSGTIATPCVTGSLNCATSIAGDQIGILSGYQAGTGYDLATGLGSVNASNMVNNWNSAGRVPSTTSLTLNGGNPVNIAHGTPVSVAVSISPNSPQPSGYASLIATQGAGNAGFDLLTVDNGTASGTTNMLPGGTSYSVQAHYAGDANYASSDSSPVTVSVSPEASQTDFHVAIVDALTGQVTNSNATSIPYGSLSVVRADITNSSGAFCLSPTSESVLYACPTGTVSFTLDGSPLTPGTAALNSQGYAENQSVPLTGGPHNFQGSYSGDSSYLASSSTDSTTVTPAPTIMGGESQSPVPVPIGPFTFGVMARSSNVGNFPVPPSGTFTIFDGSTQLPSTVGDIGTGVIYPAPNARYVWVTISGNLNTTVSGPVGTHMVTLNYSGDANYSPCTSGPFPVNEVYPTKTTLTSSSPTIPNGQPVTITAQIIPSQSAGSAPTGNVVFSWDGSVYATVPVSNNQAQINIPACTASSIFLSATYSGDNYYASSTGTFTQTFTQIGTTTSVTSSNPTVGQNANVTFTAHISPVQIGYAPLSGSVQFTANGTNIGGGQIIVGNQSQITTSFATLGSYQIQATYLGDQNYLPSSRNVTENVVSSPPDFSLTSSGTTTQTVRAGQTALFSNALSVSPLNGFASQVSLNCSLYAWATTCSVSPSSLASGTGTATLTVTTTARSFTVPFSRIRPINLRLMIALLCGILLLISLLQFTARVRRHRLAGALSFMLLALTLILQAVGCGGGGSGSPPPQVGTPAGTYNINVNGISGDITHSTSLTLIVN